MDGVDFLPRVFGVLLLARLRKCEAKPMTPDLEAIRALARDHREYSFVCGSGCHGHHTETADAITALTAEVERLRHLADECGEDHSCVHLPHCSCGSGDPRRNLYDCDPEIDRHYPKCPDCGGTGWIRKAR